MPCSRLRLSNNEVNQINQINQIIKTYVDDKTVHWLDIGHVFLNEDGTIKKELMPDCLHPNIPGYRVWAAAMAPTLGKLPCES